MTTSRRVCIIGAGTTGLSAIKACLEEDIVPVCFERKDDMGGLWNFTPQVDVGGCIMRSTVINTSKEMMAFSDFPPPARMANYMHNTRVLEYLKLYAKEYKLLPHVQFEREVCSVRQAEDYEETGCWTVQHRSVKNHDDVTTETFDGVFVCIGHHATPHRATFPGMEKFTGKVMHTHDYRDVAGAGFEDKRVLIIGIGNSGGDIAVEISRVAKQVFLSTRSGAWVLNRVGECGTPMDMVFSRRFSNLVTSMLGWKMVNRMMRKWLNKRFNHELYGLLPAHEPFGHLPTINDDLPNRIVCAAIKIKDNVKDFTETGANFIDGTYEDIDTVILATGYKFSFPFLTDEMFQMRDHKLHLYKYMYPPHLSHGTLAFIGYIQPLGAIHPISEQQSRWAVRVVKRMQTLPSEKLMREDIDLKAAKIAKRYTVSDRHAISVDWIPYMDEITSQFGACPNLWNMFFQNPSLWRIIFFYPAAPYQYRLQGPHPWKGAEAALRGLWDRFRVPFATREAAVKKVMKSKNNGCPIEIPFRMLMFGALLIVGLAYLLMQLKLF